MRFKVLCAAGVLALAAFSTGASAADPESCQTVRFADVGWTDIQATTGIATVHPERSRL